jgi:hypothetical protein
MITTRRIRRIAAALTGLACALVAFVAAAPASFAMPVPVPGGSTGGGSTAPAVPSAPVQVHTVVAGGMPGWQITLIALGAALLAATVAVLVERARAARLHATPAAA